MAKFLGLKWIDQAERWEIICRGRKPDLVARDLVDFADNGGVVDGETVGLARVPSGMDPHLFIMTLPGPDLSTCRLCRDRKPHARHYTVH